MKSLNLGILAHIDAGKTSLTERLLYTAGVIDAIGSVDAGSTQTDSLALERQRGITIKSAVVSFQFNGVTINLLDTPGHPDFIAEVERVLGVLDGVVLVISAVEGVQAQTRVLMRTLQRLNIPTLIFVNKIDRAGARYQPLLQSIAQKLTPSVIALGSVDHLGSHDAEYHPFQADDENFAAALVDLLADHDQDDTFLADYLTGGPATSPARLRAQLAVQTGRGCVHPVAFGSAITGAGVESLMDEVTELLPAIERHPQGDVSGQVFKVERGRAGERIAYVRMLSGTIRVRDVLRLRSGQEGKVTALTVFDQGGVLACRSLEAGRIGKLWGLGEVRIGDTIIQPQEATQTPAAAVRHFAPPSLETVVLPVADADRTALYSALAQLAEQDPLINLRRDVKARQIAASLYGEVQKEVIQATLATDFGLDVDFQETTTIHIERPTGTGAAVEIIDVAPNPFLATVGLRVDPAPVDTGVAFRLEVELGAMPFAFFAAVEETVRETLNQGLRGWQVSDCTVTMTRSGYWPRQSHSHGTFDPSMSSAAGDFRNLTPLVLMDALRQAGTQVFEPLHAFRLEIPAELLGALLAALAQLHAIPRTTTTRGTSYLVEGEIPAARVHSLELQLPALTGGEGVLETAFDHYEPVPGSPPSRPRTDHDPLNRKEYLLHVQRRV